MSSLIHHCVKNASSLWAYLVNALDNIHEVHLRLIYRN